MLQCSKDSINSCVVIPILCLHVALYCSKKKDAPKILFSVLVNCEEFI